MSQQQHQYLAPPAVIFTRLEDRIEGKNHLCFFTEQKLKRRLAKAIELENYEAAALYRDELLRRSNA